MPGRYLNFGALTFVAMLIGLLGSCRAIWSRLVLLFLSCGLLVTSRSMLWGFLERHHNIQFHINIRPLWIAGLSAVLLLAGAAWKSRGQRAEGEEAHPSHLHPLHLSQLFLFALVVLMTMHQHAEVSGAHFNDRTMTCSSRTSPAAQECCSSLAICTSSSCAPGVLCFLTRARSIP
jgi:hypothetical protein